MQFQKALQNVFLLNYLGILYNKTHTCRITAVKKFNLHNAIDDETECNGKRKSKKKFVITNLLQHMLKLCSNILVSDIKLVGIL